MLNIPQHAQDHSDHLEGIADEIQKIGWGGEMTKDDQEWKQPS